MASPKDWRPPRPPSVSDPAHSSLLKSSRPDQARHQLQPQTDRSLGELPVRPRRDDALTPTSLKHTRYATSSSNKCQDSLHLNQNHVPDTVRPVKRQDSSHRPSDAHIHLLTTTTTTSSARRRDSLPQNLRHIKSKTQLIQWQESHRPNHNPRQPSSSVPNQDSLRSNHSPIISSTSSRQYQNYIQQNHNHIQSSVSSVQYEECSRPINNSAYRRASFVERKEAFHQKSSHTQSTGPSLQYQDSSRLNRSRTPSADPSARRRSVAAPSHNHNHTLSAGSSVKRQESESNNNTGGVYSTTSAAAARRQHSVRLSHCNRTSWSTAPSAQIKEDPDCFDFNINPRRSSVQCPAPERQNPNFTRTNSSIVRRHDPVISNCNHASSTLPSNQHKDSAHPHNIIVPSHPRASSASYSVQPQEDSNAPRHHSRCRAVKTESFHVRHNHNDNQSTAQHHHHQHHHNDNDVVSPEHRSRVQRRPNSVAVVVNGLDLRQDIAPNQPNGAASFHPRVQSPAPPSKGQLMVRHCRIGTAVAFGVVGIPSATTTATTPSGRHDGVLPNGNGHSEGHGLVSIRMKPDEKGRFGFNVKGGADQGMPIIVSRVAPNTPADLAIPRLNEGDQVLFINGRDVSQHTHEQVVMFIKASRETHSGELALIVRPNGKSFITSGWWAGATVYVSEDQSEEPDFTYIPETHQIASSSSSSNTLESSLMLLGESLESGATIAQFEQLYRKKPGLTLNAARLDANINKNRYRDISPYDQTRVVLKNGSCGDYVNANYVNMEIPGSGMVNRYIAAQGPLPNTCTDFWQMIWEQQSSLVVMLTTKVERGRVKCHQYWPQLYETEDFGTLQITCVKEEETHSFAFREFNLTHVESGEERHIRHMQYIAWPDHGVPDDPSDFLHFVIRVRQNREGMVEPTVVHCSAGIGRTGVLITMETAMCLIESNQPVYPLTIVRQMRDQRAMLIQTSSQYKFVCEAILRVYNEALIKPQEDFRR